MRSAFGTVKSFGAEGLEVGKGRNRSGPLPGRFSGWRTWAKVGSELKGSCEEDEVHRSGR